MLHASSTMDAVIRWAGLLSLIGLVTAAAPAAEPEIAFFQEKVEPLLKKHCYECHSHVADKASGGLVLDSKAGWESGGDFGPAVVPGKPEESPFITAINYDDFVLQMPPDGKLPAEEIAILVQWVEFGAPDPRTDGQAAEKQGIDLDGGRQFWSFRPLSHPRPPVTSDREGPVTEVDRFVLKPLEDAGLSPVRDAEPEVLLRRLYYDLTGLPPSPAQLNSFVARVRGREGITDKSYQAAIEQECEHLLASPAFGEKWGRHWLDVARYADSNGSSFNPPFREAWRYRNWVIDSFNGDRPFDDFVMRQVAGDLLPYDTQEERDGNLIATGYLMLGSKVLGEFDKEVLQMDVVDEQLDVIGKSLLGLSLGCARCHDHRFDPIPQSDYYALAGILTSTVTLEDRIGGLKDDESDWSRRGLGPGGDQMLSEFLQNDRYKWHRATVTAFDAREALDKLVRESRSPSTERKRELIGKLEEARAKAEESEAKLRELESRMPTFAMAARDADDPADTELRIRGVAGSTGEVVPRGFLQVASYEGQPIVNVEQSGRLELARWLVSSQNPLTARVWVNRVWKHLFHEGIVRSVDDFGSRGEAPTHPELLDHLASRFIDNGWRTKPLIRTIVTSRAYRMSTAASPVAEDTDPENRLLWRQNRRRLEPEEIRDTLLILNETLDPLPAAGPIDHLPITDVSNRLANLNLSDNRRTIYQPVIRTLEPDVLQIFDFANTAMPTGSRPTTTVAPQALYFLNSPLVQETAESVAVQLTSEYGREPSDLIPAAFLRLTGREPTSLEVALLERYLAHQFEGPPGPTDHDAAKLVQVILASTQFQFLD